MKENFFDVENYKKDYRDNLAKDLKEIRKTDPEKAQEVLDDEKDTILYQVSNEHHREDELEKRQVKKGLLNFTSKEKQEADKEYQEHIDSLVSIEKHGENLQESYFNSIDKKVIDEVVDTIIALKEYYPIIHSGNLIKKVIEEKVNDVHVEDNDYFRSEGYLEDMIEKGAIAKLDHMVLMPGEEGFFQIQYLIKKDKKVLVDYFASDAQKSGFDSWDFKISKPKDNRVVRELSEETDDENMAKMFKKFTGHTELFEADLDQLKEMFANDKRIADSLIKEVEKTIEDQGEVTSYKDFINRLDYLE